jgi:hypothetical protein
MECAADGLSHLTERISKRLSEKRLVTDIRLVQRTTCHYRWATLSSFLMINSVHCDKHGTLAPA